MDFHEAATSAILDAVEDATDGNAADAKKETYGDRGDGRLRHAASRCRRF